MPELTDVQAELQFSAEAKLTKMDWEDLQQGGRVILALHVPCHEPRKTPKGMITIEHPIGTKMGIAITKPDVPNSLMWTDLELPDLFPGSKFILECTRKFSGKRFRVYMEEVK